METLSDVSDVAKIAAEAATQTVRDAMRARHCPSPWEVTEAWLKIRVLESLYKSGLRVFDELPANAISNIVVNAESNKHPFDVAVLYPVETGNPWHDRRNRAALGLVELKKSTN